MVRVTMDDLARDPLSLLRRAEAGETFIVTRTDRPVAEIRPAPSTQQAQRPVGLAKGEFTVPDDFDSPLPDDVIADFQGR